MPHPNRHRYTYPTLELLARILILIIVLELIWLIWVNLKSATRREIKDRAEKLRNSLIGQTTQQSPDQRPGSPRSARSKRKMKRSRIRSQSAPNLPSGKVFTDRPRQIGNYVRRSDQAYLRKYRSTEAVETFPVIKKKSQRIDALNLLSGHRRK